MSDISGLSNAASASRSISYERSESVEVSTQTLREANAITEIRTKTTTRRTKEISKSRQELESKIRQLNSELQKLENSEASIELEEGDEPKVKLVDSKMGISLDLSKNLEDVLNTNPSERSGLFLNTVA